MWIPFIGLLAGMLTTLSGFGGGILLVSSLALWLGPEPALVISAMALWVGNAHRFYLFRKDVRLDIALPLLFGIVPGAAGVATLIPALPPLVLAVSILCMSALAVARLLFAAAWRPRNAVIVPLGLVIGGLSATAGGAGMLVAPLLLGCGLSGGAYLATASVLAISMHVARLAGYSLGGMVTLERAGIAIALAVAIVLGNTLGAFVRARLPRAWLKTCELLAPAACIFIALFALFG